MVHQLAAYLTFACALIGVLCMLGHHIMGGRMLMRTAGGAIIAGALLAMMTFAFGFLLAAGDLSGGFSRHQQLGLILVLVQVSAGGFAAFSLLVPQKHEIPPCSVHVSMLAFTLLALLVMFLIFASPP